MTDSKDQSYYEIALTNRQVMGIFVVLLVCVVVAFLSGVWIGRGNVAPEVATVEAQVIESGIEPGEAPLEELEFFRRDELAAEARPAAVAAPEGQDTGELPVIIEQVADTEPEPAEPTPQPAAVAAPEGREAGEPPVIIERVADTESEPAEATAQPPATSPIQQAETVAPGGEPLPLVVQVFSSTDAEQAEQVLEKLRGGGYPAQLASVDVGGTPMYRVRVGPYESRDEAQLVADRVRRAYKLDTWITR